MKRAMQSTAPAVATDREQVWSARQTVMFFLYSSAAMWAMIVGALYFITD